MDIKISLPGDKYYSIPADVIEKYSVSKADFDKSLEEESVTDDVSGQCWACEDNSGGSGWPAPGGPRG